MMPRNGSIRAAASLALAVVLAACASAERATDDVAVEIRGTDPLAPPTGTVLPGTASVSDPIASGAVVDYGDYRVAVAREGDTVSELAARIGLSATELAAYNGVQPGTPLLEGDELVLPEGASVGVAAVPAPQDAPVEVVQLEPEPELEPVPSPSPDTSAATAPSPRPSDAREPWMVAAAEPNAASAPSALEEEDEEWSPARAAAAIDRSDEEKALPPPPSAADPLPPIPTEPRDLASPDLGQYQTPRGRGAPFELARPVEGPIAVPFNTGAGPNRNDGVDFAASAGAPVVAAEDGEVALVSESLGGLGTIVLIRHPDDLMTVYGRLDQVTVQKGDFLERGQQFGVVATAPAGTEPRMHFEVRRGADSVDPMTML